MTANHRYCSWADAMIAATALDAGAELHTCNASHYAAMSDLAIAAVAT